jgi:hypothetical protein
MTWARMTGIALAMTVAGVAAAQSLSFDVYKAKVEPIFLKKRPSHARCVVCHSGGGNAFRLQPLAQGATAWTEEESRKNFESVSKLINSSNLLASPLLKHPLAPEGGGDEFHSGGRQFKAKTDSDWKTIYDWASGAK